MTHHTTDVTPSLRLLAVFLASALISACATNPVTGRRELSLISEAQEIQMGREASAGDLQRVGEVTQPEVQAMVRRIGMAMATHSERPNLPWEFHVLDDAAVNAFAYPGGFIFVTRGLLTNISSEAELAEVIGHEIGHVTAKHSVVAMSQQQLAQIGLVGASIFSSTVAKYGDLIGGGASLLFLKFGRDDELQADALGFRYSLAQGFDVRESPRVFEMLGRLSGGEGRIPEWQSTHPDPGNRVQRAEQRIAQLAPGVLDTTRVGRESFLKTISGLVFGENPRNGYFEGTRFLHPDLRFQLDFPTGWRVVNQPEAVIAASGDHSAQLQLVPASGTPAQAMQSFLKQEGIAVRQSSQVTVNGLAGASAAFQVVTQEGDLEGRALAVSHQQQTYMLLGLTVPQAAAMHGPEIDASLRSFRALTDPVALNRQPMRVELVTLDQAMTGSQFVQRYSGGVPAEQIYIANGIEATTQLPRGMVLKRVR